MAIYRTGQASMDAQGYITGYDTKWREQLTLIRPGATIFFIDAPFQAAVISEVISDTQIRAITTGGAEIGRSNYIILLHDSITVDGLAQDVAETLRYYQSKETQIEEVIDFFKNFDLQGLKDLANQVKNDAEKTASDRAATEQLRNETNQIKVDTDSIKTQTQQIKDSATAEINLARDQGVSLINQTKDQAVTDINQIKNETSNIRDEAKNALSGAETARDSAIGYANDANNAKAGAETARDEARQWAQQIQPESMLHKDQNLGDVPDKALARINLQLDRFNQGDVKTFIQSPDKIKYLTVDNDGWGYWNTESQQFIPLSVDRGGTGGTTTFSACRSLRAMNYGHASNTLYASPELDTGIGFYSADVSTWPGGDGSPYNYAEIMTIAEGGGGPGSSGNWSQIGFSTITKQAPRYRQRFSNPALITDWNDFLVRDLNTTIDINGFVKIASPIVKIKGDGSAEFNMESEGCIVTRDDVGVYTIKGCLGLNSDAAWGGSDGGFEIPIDINKQPRIWLDYSVKPDGSVTIRTYHRTHPNSPEFARNEIEGFLDGDPIDIPGGCFISVRVQMPNMN